MPLPLNHSTKRLSIASAFTVAAPGEAAYAVPWELNIDTSGGNPSAPSIVRREILTRFVITCDTFLSSLRQCGTLAHQRGNQFFEAKARPTKIIINAADERPVGRCFHSPGNIAEILLYNAFLALFAAREHGPQLRRRAELGAPDSSHVAGRIDVQIYFLHLTRPAPAFTPAPLGELKLKLLPPRSHSVEPLQAESDRVDQLVAGGATRVSGMLGHPVAVRLRASLGNWRQIGVDTRRRVRNMLAQKLLTHEQTAR